MTLSTIEPTAALVVIDLQNGLRETPTVPATVEEIITRTVGLSEAFRRAELPVVLVRVSTEGAGFSPGRSDHGRAAVNRPEGWDTLVPELTEFGDAVVTKHNPGAFIGTDLDLVLRRRGVTQIVLTGVSTSMGVEGTARQAYDLGYDVVVVTDAVGDRELVDHDHAVGRMLPRIAETTSTQDVLARLP